MEALLYMLIPIVFIWTLGYCLENQHRELEKKIDELKQLIEAMEDKV